MPDGDAGVRYKALAAGVIRTGAAMDSPKADPEKLTVGQEFVVTETEIVAGTLRLKFDGGCKYTLLACARARTVLRCTKPARLTTLGTHTHRDLGEGQERQSAGGEALL